METQTTPPKAPEGRPLRRFVGVMSLLFVALVLVGLLPYEHHPYFDFEEIPAFMALFPLVVCLGLALLETPVQTTISVEEEAYDAE